MILGVAKLAATAVSYSSGSSGGIFGPSLYIGGMLGGAVGLLTRSIPGNVATQPGAFALVGMGAVFAGIVRAPVTSIVIIFEMTGNYSMILPLMIANIISYAFASRLSPVPIYDALLEQDGVKLPHNEIHALRKLTVGQVMSRQVLTLREDLSVKQAFDQIQTLGQYHAYPLVDLAGGLVGLLAFNDLKRALAAGLGSSNLRDITNREPVITYPELSLDTALIQLVRAKISQLPVVNLKDSKRLIGIITMHDLAKALSKTSDSRSDNREASIEAPSSGHEAT
jgi:CIC family chloride channel protein